MADNINVNLGASNTTGNTANPQAGAKSSSLAGQPQTLQTSNSSSSINTQSSGISIQLPPASELRTTAIQTSTPKPKHNVSAAGISIVGVIALLAVVVGIYIYLSDKKAVKNT